MRSTVVATLLALAGCRSAPATYYTLVAPPTATAPATGDRLQLDVLPVDVPADVDRSELVVRLGAGRVAPVDSRSWIAPLPLEIRRALSDDLTGLLGARDVAGLTPAPGQPVYRVKVTVHRFESALGDRALIDAVWSVREAGATGGSGSAGSATSAAPLTCATRASEPAHGDYEGVVEAHQKALATIAAAIATGVHSLASGGAAACPP
nr:PqiC family protein [Kofleriaceae bacterium]